MFVYLSTSYSLRGDSGEAYVILSVTKRSTRCFPRFLSRKEDFLACCPSRAVSLRQLALELVELAPAI